MFPDWNAPDSLLPKLWWSRVLQNKACVMFYKTPMTIKLGENFDKISIVENSKVIYDVYLGGIYKIIGINGGATPVSTVIPILTPSALRVILEIFQRWALKWVSEWECSGIHHAYLT